jgi:cytidine deaminase
MNTKEASIKCDYKIYNDDNELSSSDQDLINQARLIAHKAYAPYSGFKVGAVAQMKNGSIINGTNQENASYPIGLCAERVLLAAVSSLAIDQPITTMAIATKQV